MSQPTTQEFIEIKKKIALYYEGHNDNEYRNDQQAGVFNEVHSIRGEMKVKSEYVTVDGHKVRHLVTKDKGKDSPRTWCIYGDECPLRNPTMNEEGKWEDGKCTLYHAGYHNGKLCTDGLDCPLLDVNGQSDKTGCQHFCGSKHAVPIEIYGNNRNSNKGGQSLSKFSLYAFLCTGSHRAGKELPHSGAKVCTGLHIVKKNENGVEVVANIGDEAAYIKLSGSECKNPKNVIDLTGDYIMRVVPSDGSSRPDQTCGRTWYDCPPEHQAQEGKCNHFVLINAIYKRWNIEEERFQTFKLVTKLRMLVNSKNSKNPSYLNSDQLVDKKKTEERRRESGNPNDALVAGVSWGSKIDKQGSTISVFISTGTSTSNE